MATVRAFIRTSKKSKRVNIRFTLTDGRNVKFYLCSDLSVNSNEWDTKSQCIKQKILFKGNKIEFERKIIEYKELILNLYEEHKGEYLTSDILQSLIYKKLHPNQQVEDDNNFFILMDEFLNKKKFSDVRKRDFRVLIRALKRYELLKIASGENDFSLDIKTLNSDTLSDIEDFIRNEYILCKKYPEIYAQIHESRQPQIRGDNTICSMFRRLRAFVNWCREHGKTDNNPFAKYEGVNDIYGTPFYITIEERNKIADFDLSDKPHLERQRDIFIFQCLIGCRVSDLLKMKPENIINGAVEYIPRKTIEERPEVVRVPLGERAQCLIKKYKDVDVKGRLFPFISDVKYNVAIKEIFSVCDITRIITILDPKTRKERKVPINTVASSHIARRTFVGNLYKKVKDPNLVGSLSGHKEGSRAFSRYREIDDELKCDIIKLIDS